MILVTLVLKLFYKRYKVLSFHFYLFPKFFFMILNSTLFNLIARVLFSYYSKPVYTKRKLNTKNQYKNIHLLIT